MSAHSNVKRASLGGRWKAVGTAAPILNILNKTAFPASNFSTASTSFVDLLDAAAGSPISVSITKAAGTDLYVYGDLSGAVTGGGGVITVGVNDGTTDRSLGTVQAISYYRLAAGGIIITGLAAGTYTLKLRVKVSANSLAFNNAVNSATITVAEVGTGAENIKAASILHTGVSAMHTSSTSYVDLQAPDTLSSAVSVTITKGAGTDLIVRGSTQFLADGASNTLTLGFNDGTNDHDLASSFGFSTSQATLAGETTLSGLAAGTYTLKLRVKAAAGTSSTWTPDAVSSSISVMEKAVGAVKNSDSFFSSTFTIGSTSFQDVLTGGGGSAISVSFTKISASTKLLVSGAVTYNTGSADNTCILGVNDGTNDTAMASNGVTSSGNRPVVAEGAVLLSGLAAGTYTLKLRAKGANANTLSFSGGWNAYLTVRETQ